MKYSISLMLAISFFCIPNTIRNDIPASSLASLPKTLEANYLIKIPSYKGCFTLDIQDELDFPQLYLDTLFIVGALYDHIEGKTKYLGTLSFPDLQEKISTDDNIFSFAAVPDSAEFLLYVLQKDPQTKKITPLEPLNFLTINFSSANDQTCDAADATTFLFTSEELEKAQKAWALQGGSFRAQAKKYWNSLTPQQKRKAKFLLFTGALLLWVILRKSLSRKTTPATIFPDAVSDEEIRQYLGLQVGLKNPSKADLAIDWAREYRQQTTDQERKKVIDDIKNMINTQKKRKEQYMNV